MEWRLIHRTCYRFDHPVPLGPHQLRLRPSGPIAGEVREHRLQIWPKPSLGHWRQDLWNNWVYQAWFAEPVKQLTLVSRFRFRPKAQNPFNFAVEREALTSPPTWGSDWDSSVATYLQVGESLDWLAPWKDYPGDSVALGVDLNRAVHQAIAYELRWEPGVQTPQETLNRGQGSCRDTAWLLVECLRQLGYPARFVSGYWLQTENSQGELHAWCEYYLPGAGWIGLDPTAGLVVNQQHVALARAPFPEAAAPLQGTHGAADAGCSWDFQVRVVRSR